MGFTKIKLLISKTAHRDVHILMSKYATLHGERDMIMLRIWGWEIILGQPDRSNVDLVRGRREVGHMLKILVLRDRTGE